MSWFECSAWSSASLERIFPAKGCYLGLEYPGAPGSGTR
jgi:hypothetical protein